ncbi:DUF1415 domain-containing protein [Sulfuriferula sp. AH1]|uniref:DUF1415 domain-containing protein n=1 Tax=Sulfuriferula sp. AH1 TaxID=1985873 RepID=UPI001CB94DE9|nr:DUF1415 domain-containing protein [Sulfuriferula sp. AH1]
MDADKVIRDTQDWLEKAVIGLNLCPFAKAVHVKQQIRYAVSNATTAEALLEDLLEELYVLHESDPEVIDTTLLIHPYVLDDFLDYNDFLDVADAAAAEPQFNDDLQIASFHPQFQFADTGADDIENYTNRSPYPMLHLLREDSVERAVAAFPEAEQIYEKNMATLRALGHAGWKRLMSSSD